MYDKNPWLYLYICVIWKLCKKCRELQWDESKRDIFFILTNYFCLCMKWRNFICFCLTAKCKHHKHNFMITCYLLEMSVSSVTHTTSLLCNLALIFDPSWLMFLFNLNNLQNMHDASKLSQSTANYISTDNHFWWFRK